MWGVSIDSSFRLKEYYVHITLYTFVIKYKYKTYNMFTTNNPNVLRHCIRTIICIIVQTLKSCILVIKVDIFINRIKTKLRSQNKNKFKPV